MNTYQDDLTKGLSSLQENILAWAYYETSRGRLASLESRPSFRKDDRWYKDQIITRGYSKSNVAAFSRALRRLEQRGLLERYTWGSKIFRPKAGKTNLIVLTDSGKEAGKQLLETINPVGWHRSRFEKPDNPAPA